MSSLSKYKIAFSEDEGTRVYVRNLPGSMHNARLRKIRFYPTIAQKP